MNIQDNSEELALCKKRRQHLIAQMGPDSLAILFAAPEVYRNGDAHYPYRQNSNFQYLTAFPEAEAIIVIAPNRKGGEYILFNRPRDETHELWTGKRAGQKGAMEIYGADEAFPISDFVEKLPDLLANRSAIYYPLGENPHFEQQLWHALEQLRTQARRGIAVPEKLLAIEQLVSEMRLIKDEYEITLMQKAAEISVEAHRLAMQACQPGMFEYQLAALLQYGFLVKGCRAPAYDTIVGSGANSCVLHYTACNAPISAEGLVLIDAGGEYKNYAADITRTFPANGKFSGAQRAIYEIVLAAQKAGIAKIKPDVPWNAIQEAMVRIITEGLLSVGLLKGDLEELIADHAYRQFYMHSSGHWLGLDVHDAGVYRVEGQWRSLQKNMVLTVEPGIYIAPHTKGVDAKWWGIGIRIEDDILVADQGCTVLSEGLEKEINEIEQVMTEKFIGIEL